MQFSHMIRPDEILSSEKNWNAEVGLPQSDFRKLRKGDVFFCAEGSLPSGFSYAKEEIAAIVTSAGGAERIGTASVPVIEVANVRKSYALAWSRHENDPAKDLRLIAITGTNGKTSVASFLYTLLRAAGRSVGLIGTVAYIAGENLLPASYTTPPPEVLYPLLRNMKERCIDTVVMEASSHAIAQHRLYGLQFETAVFTNLSRDHLDYHKTWEAYRDTKASLFAHAKNAVICLDDPQARYMGFAAAGDVYYYGKDPEADFQIHPPIYAEDGIRYSLTFGGASLPVELHAVGNFHAENSAAAIACAYLEGLDPPDIVKGVRLLQPPKGRLEKLNLPTDFSVYIDYAHSPEALERALLSLRPFTGKLTVLFGAGGERDRGKRPEMGAIAEKIADLIILTDDNPRSEDPEAIISDIEKGMRGGKHLRIRGREKAISHALGQAEKGEILLFAGKGHENYTIDQNGKHSFSEKEIIEKILGLT